MEYSHRRCHMSTGSRTVLRSSGLSQESWSAATRCSEEPESTCFGTLAAAWRKLAIIFLKFTTCEMANLMDTPGGSVRIKPRFGWNIIMFGVYRTGSSVNGTITVGFVGDSPDMSSRGTGSVSDSTYALPPPILLFRDF